VLTRNDKDLLFSQHALELRSWTTNNLPTLDAVHEVAALSVALPEIEIKKEAAFVAACKKWLRVRQCEKFFRAEKGGIVEFLAESLLIEDWQTETNAALQQLSDNFHFFGGKTRGDFLLWAAKRLNNLPALKKHATLRDYIAMGIDDFDDTKPDMSDFKFTEHAMPFGKEYHVQLEGGHVWRVRDLRDARALWPVHVRTVKGTPYLVKLVQGHTIYVHRLFFRIEIDDVVRAFDGDYLNMSLYPFSRHTEVYWGDWATPEKTHKSKLIRAEGTKPILTSLKQEWVPNLHISHDTNNASAQDRQTKFEKTRMLQPLELEDDDGEKKQVNFGGMSTGYASPVSTSDVVRPIVANKNTPAWVKLDREDKFESEGVQYDMAVATIRDRNREADHAQDGDVAGLKEQVRPPAPDRASLVEDVAAMEAEIAESEN
jgi:hypothetical protein